MTCPICEMRQEVDALRAQRHAEHVKIQSVLIAEEPDRTVARIYKTMTAGQRRRLLDLLSEIDHTQEDE